VLYNYKSEEFLTIVRNTCQQPEPLLNRTLSSYHPIKIYYGILFHYKPGSLLTYLSIVIDNVISLILSYGG
jgi:hypothetical protein